MSIDINFAALGAFRNVNFGNADAIANLKQGDGVEQNGKLGSFLGKMFRSSATKANNNAVRTELLKSLGQAFGLSGMSEAGGKTTFSADFMAKLEGILGRDVLKTADFKLNRDGSVTSGKPLTQRRIQAIVNKAMIASRGQYDASVYRAKLDSINAKIATMPEGPGTKVAMQDHFAAVGKLVDFMDKELDGLFDENFTYNPQKDQEGDNVPYVLVTKLGGKYEQKPLKSIGMVTQYIHDFTGQLFHIQENILAGVKNIAQLSDLDDPPEQITAYLKRAMTEFVMASIDTYLDADKAGKLDGYQGVITHAWPCIEGKTSGITEFRLTNLPLEDVNPAAGPAEVNVNAVATHDKNQPLNQCIGREISALDAKGVKFESWKDVAAAVKQNLIGTIRPIDVPVKDGDGWKFELLRDEKGQPVVREITEEDIDRLGEACMEAILLGL